MSVRTADRRDLATIGLIGRSRWTGNGRSRWAGIRLQFDRIPGSPQVVKREVREWVCSECDYFEEVDETSGSAATERPT